MLASHLTLTATTLHLFTSEGLLPSAKEQFYAQLPMI